MIPPLRGRPKTAICFVSEEIQTAYVYQNTLRVLDFFASLHLTIFEQPRIILNFSTTG